MLRKSAPSKKPSLFWLLTVIAFGLAFIGLIAIYNASVIESYQTFGDKYHFVKQQSKWLMLAAVVYFSLSFVPSKVFEKTALPFFVVSLVFLVAVIIPGVGTKLLGARRWLDLGPISFQPSELIKISMVLYLSFWLKDSQPFKNFVVIIGACLGLIMLQPDLGTAVVVSSIGFTLYYLSGCEIKRVLMFLTGLLGFVVILIFSSPYRMDRLQTFLDPQSDPLGRSYHINQVLLGLGSGGFSGVGLGKSRQKYAYLPEATTDSIFTIIGEETGFVGGTILILMLLALCMVGFRIASQATDKHQRLIAAGIATLFASQTFVNISAMVALVPLTGVPLPLISYGGSALVSNFISLGILSSIAKNK